MYGRDYSPVFDRSLEEYYAMIKEIMGNKPYIVLVNDAPYNVFSSNGSNRKCETIHYTMYYNDSCNMTGKLRSEIQRFKKMGFSYQEVADDLKSIAIPHVHFIKNKKDVIGA